MFPVPSFVSTCPAGGYLWHLSHSSHYVTHVTVTTLRYSPCLSLSLSLVPWLTETETGTGTEDLWLSRSDPQCPHLDYRTRAETQLWLTEITILSFVGFTLLKYMFVIGDSSLIMLWLNCAVAVHCPEKDRHLSPVSGSTLPPSHCVVIPIKAAE